MALSSQSVKIGLLDTWSRFSVVDDWYRFPTKIIWWLWVVPKSLQRIYVAILSEGSWRWQWGSCGGSRLLCPILANIRGMLCCVSSSGKCRIHCAIFNKRTGTNSADVVQQVHMQKYFILFDLMQFCGLMYNKFSVAVKQYTNLRSSF